LAKGQKENHPQQARSQRGASHDPSSASDMLVVSGARRLGNLAHTAVTDPQASDAAD
jgi:hypothetical protein